MKKLFALTFLFIACNNENKSGTEKTAQGATDKKENSSTSGCSKMVFFREGAEIDTKTYDGGGKETGSQHTKIVSVKDEAGMTVATAESTNDKDSTTNKPPSSVTYKCDGNKIYVDVASMLNGAGKDRGGKFEASPIEYPINISEGETLPDATGIMNMETRGKSMTVTYHFKNRKVEGKEEVTTPAGTWTCYKISHSIETEMDIPGMDERMKKAMDAMKDKIKTTSVTWFAPDLGVLKSATYQNGKLISSNEIVGVKK